MKLNLKIEENGNNMGISFFILLRSVLRAASTVMGRETLNDKGMLEFKWEDSLNSGTGTIRTATRCE
jgi:hypothetical protein